MTFSVNPELLRQARIKLAAIPASDPAMTGAMPPGAMPPGAAPPPGAMPPGAAPPPGGEMPPEMMAAMGAQPGGMDPAAAAMGGMPPGAGGGGEMPPPGAGGAPPPGAEPPPSPAAGPSSEDETRAMVQQMIQEQMGQAGGAGGMDGKPVKPKPEEMVAQMSGIQRQIAQLADVLGKPIPATAVLQQADPMKDPVMAEMDRMQEMLGHLQQIAGIGGEEGGQSPDASPQPPGGAMISQAPDQQPPGAAPGAPPEAEVKMASLADRIAAHDAQRRARQGR